VEGVRGLCIERLIRLKVGDCPRYVVDEAISSSSRLDADSPVDNSAEDSDGRLARLRSINQKTGGSKRDGIYTGISMVYVDVKLAGVSFF
jgi:hypothetical protein